MANKAEAGQVGGIKPERVHHMVKVINQAVEEAKEINDSANEDVKAFGEDGGHVQAIRLIAKLKRWEPARAQEFLRAVDQYSHDEGLWDQLDMLDPKKKASGERAGAVN